METYDVIVVGLGAMGIATTYQLAKSGATVLGIEQFSLPHTSGSSYGDSRSIRQAIGEGIDYVPLVLRSYEIWREIEQETGKSLLTITGGLIISSEGSAITHVENFFENTIGAAKKYNMRYDLLSSGQIRERFPQFNVSSTEMGYFEKNSGFLRPEACITAQAELAQKHNAVIHTQEKVFTYSDNGSEVSVKTDKGEYKAKKLVLAAGGWLPKFLSEELGRYFTVIRQVVYWFDPKEQADAFSLGKFPVFIWQLPNNKQDILGYPALDAQSGVKIVTEQYDTPTTPDTVERTISQEEIASMYKTYVAPYFPSLSSDCLKAMACLYTVTPDFGFVIDFHPNDKNVIIVSPCSGHGFKHSAAIGEVVAQLATKGVSDINIQSFSIQRFLK